MSGSKTRILIVGTADTYKGFFKGILRKPGVHIDLADRVRDAQCMLAQVPYDWLICEVAAFDEQALDALEAITAADDAPRTVVICAAHVRNRVLATGVEAAFIAPLNLCEVRDYVYGEARMTTA